MRARFGELADWTITDYLLALAKDELAVANWQRSVDGVKGRNFPKPTYRPGQKPPGDDDDGKTFGKGAKTFAEIDAIFEQLHRGDDVSQSKSEPRTSRSSRAQSASNETSPEK